jgi:putative endonuclease
MLWIKPRAKHLQSGDNAELQALNFLRKQGLLLLHKNYRCKSGELDLVMQDGKFLVVVEMRFRKSDYFGSAVESITWQKQQRIIAATGHYVIINKIGNVPIRFDVVAISGDQQINWIKNAFQT